jgi:hypothetical protein
VPRQKTYQESRDSTEPERWGAVNERRASVIFIPEEQATASLDAVRMKNINGMSP